MDNCLTNENSNIDINNNQELIRVEYPTSTARRHLTVEKHSQKVIFLFCGQNFYLIDDVIRQ